MRRIADAESYEKREGPTWRPKMGGGMENARQDPDDTRQKVRFCELQIYCWSRQFPVPFRPIYNRLKNLKL